MLTFILTDINGDSHTLTNPVSMTFNSEENVPADDLSVVFPWDELPELTTIEAYDGAKLFFRGVIDEQMTIISRESICTRLAARSMAALLLDNEAKPVCYNHPSASVIFERHLKPYGFADFKGENAVVKRRFIVPKGMTEWQVLEKFCRKSFGGSPRISSTGIVYINSREHREHLVFSDRGERKYISIKENTRRCKLLSEVCVKVEEGSSYDFAVRDEEALSRGVVARRYYDASLNNNEDDIAVIMLNNARKASYEITLTVPGRITDALGAAAEVRNSRLGERRGLYVSSIFYRLGSGGEFTTLRLRKEGTNVDT